MKRGSFVVVVAAVLSLAAAPDAAAHTVKWASKPRITHVERANSTISRIDGVVFSAKAACLPGRTVEVWAGNQHFGADPSTSADGSWSIAGSAPSGVPLRVRVLRMVLDSTEVHNHICMGNAKRYSPR